MTEEEILQKAKEIWEKQEKDAWEFLKLCKDRNSCNCGESYELIEARIRWCDISMAKRYFENIVN